MASLLAVLLAATAALASLRGATAPWANASGPPPGARRVTVVDVFTFLCIKLQTIGSRVPPVGRNLPSWWCASIPHCDHVGGFAPIVPTLRVDVIADSGQRYGGRAFNDGLREATLHHVPVHVARCGDRWSNDDGVTLAVLSPCGALFADGKNDVNENSVVVMLAYRDFRMLFMGDAGFQAEQRLLESGGDVHADVPTF